MLKRTQKEVEKYFFNAFACDEKELKVSFINKCWSIHIEKSYGLDIIFKDLLAMSKFFGTEEINEDRYNSEGGCDTCDYGKVYYLDFTIG